MTTTSDAIGARGVAACFFATFGISLAGAVVLGPKTAGWYVIGLGVVFVLGAAVLDLVRSLAADEVER